MAEELNGLPMRKRYGIIMICCVSFFYIEILRRNWPTAMMHLANGIRLMSNLPDAVQDVFRHPEIFSHDRDNSHARATYMTKLLRRWEGSAAFMRINSPPSLSLQAYETRKNSVGGVREFTSLEKLQEHVDDLFQDVNAFGWMCRQYRGDDSSWDHAAARFQFDILHQRCYHIRELLKKANKLYGDMEDAANPRDFLKFMGCLLRHRGASIALDSTPLPQGMAYTPPDEEEDKFLEVASIAETINQALRASLASGAPGSSPWFNVDFGVVTTLYIAASNCYTVSMSEKLFEMMINWPWREDLWDGTELRRQLYDLRKPIVEVPTATTPDSETPVPTTPHLIKLAHRPPSRVAVTTPSSDED
ncbi:nuclear pore protein [Trichoderma gamsii]|uniref:Nuclear pore protein n=2 Tax=Trichoderma gamsii TaxID=398673 RepID=A0A2P4ZDS0_9HYPO|nr:nuclear pore protein [Trichoderma gamsii]PON22442.1 nuclear pore protein [Trichoderma gamsii]